MQDHQSTTARRTTGMSEERPWDQLGTHGKHTLAVSYGQNTWNLSHTL